MKLRSISSLFGIAAILLGLCCAPVHAQDTAATTPAALTTLDSSVAAPVQAAPQPPVPPPPLTKPTLVDASTISGGDTAWMLTSTALVLLMTLPGLALCYAGMVRKKNALGTMAHSFVTVCVATILWVVIGYSLAFTPGSPFIGTLDRFMLHGMDFLKEAGKLTVHHVAPTIPESVFMMFQMTFAIITPALITGAFAERMKFSALLWFIALWSLAVYAPVAHWVWEPTGWLAARGVLDFAGGTVVHINAGISGLVAALMVGPRRGFGQRRLAIHHAGTGQFAQLLDQARANFGHLVLTRSRRRIPWPARSSPRRVRASRRFRRFRARPFRQSLQSARNGRCRDR